MTIRTACISLVTILMLSATALAREADDAPAPGTPAQSSPRGFDPDSTPFSLSGAFSYAVYDNFNGISGELQFGIGLGGGLEFGITLDMGSTDLEGASTGLLRPSLYLGNEFVVDAGAIQIGLVGDGRLGLMLLTIEPDGGGSGADLSYLVLEADFTARFYVTPILYPFAGLNVGADIGLGSSVGQRPNDTFAIGINVGFGVRF